MPDHFRPEHFVFMFFLAVIVVVIVRAQRRGAAERAATTEAAEPPPRVEPPKCVCCDAPHPTEAAEPPPRVEPPKCVCCDAPHPTEAAPQLIEVRSLIDSSWVDDLLLKLGFQRTVRHAVNVLRDIDVRPTLCRECFRIARARCEDKVAAIQAARSKALVGESEDVARFAAFGLVDLVRASVSQQRERNTVAQGGQAPAAEAIAPRASGG